MITLHESNLRSNPNTMGLGSLPDAISCTVKEELNGSFELEMEYPITGLHFSEIELNRLIYCKSNPFSNRQLFRIYSITKPINGIVTVNAQHISYDLSGYPISSIEAVSAGDALTKIPGCIPELSCPFTFYTDISAPADSDNNQSLAVITPISVRALLGEERNSILSVFGGEYEFDNFDVKLYSRRGHDRGAKIVYGKNMLDLEQEENCNKVYTGIYPFAYNEEEGLTELDTELSGSSKFVNAIGTYDFVRILPVDFSSNWSSAPTRSELLNAANQYITDNGIGIPEVNLTVSFTNLSDSPEYENFSLLENVYLGDIVSVEFLRLGVSASAKCVSTTYNVILDRYTEVELGSTVTNLGDVLLDQTKKIAESIEKIIGENIPTRSFVEEKAMEAARLISGGLGGYVVLHDSSGANSHPDELLIMDTDNINTAQHIWRFNKNGLAYLNNGYSDTSAEIALTSDGYIKSERILASEILAERYGLQSSATLSHVIQAIPEGLQLSAVNQGDTYTTTESHYERVAEDVGVEDISAVIPSPDTTVFGFTKEGAYWVSTNAGIDKSFSYITLNFDFDQETRVTIECSSDGEQGWDYGLITTVGGSINGSYDENNNPSPDVLFTFRYEEPSTSFRTIFVDVPAGHQTITFKYVKDTTYSGNTDRMMFRCTAEVERLVTTTTTHTTPAYTKSISLKYKDEGENTGWVVSSTVPLVFGGLVRFVDLFTEGATEINGGNILTDNLRVNEVKYYENGYWYPIASGRIHGPSTMTYIGARNVTNLGIHNLYLFGTSIYFTKIGMTSNDTPSYGNESLVIDTGSHILRPNTDGQWDIGAQGKYFNSLYVKKIYLTPDNPSIYLDATPYGTLRWGNEPIA